jgi:hypothetical protein
MEKDEEHGDQEADVADAVRHERLLGRHRRDVPLEPEAHQPVGAKTDSLPPEEVEQEIVRQHEHEHREEEQVEVDEKPVEAGVPVHVADGVQVDGGRHAGDEQRHGDRQGIYQQGGVDLEAGHREPAEYVQVGDAVVRRQAEQVYPDDYGGDERAARGGGADPTGNGFTEAASPDQVDDKAQERERNYGVSGVDHGAVSPSGS